MNFYFMAISFNKYTAKPLNTHHHHHHHHHISFMELGHLLTRSGLTYPEVSSKVYHDSFCQLGSTIYILNTVLRN